MALEGDGEIQHRLLQQARLRAHLVGRDRLELGGERGIEDADIGFDGRTALGRQHVIAGEHGDGGCGEQQAGFAEEEAARLERGGGVGYVEEGHGGSPDGGWVTSIR